MGQGAALGGLPRPLLVHHPRLEVIERLRDQEPRLHHLTNTFDIPNAGLTSRLDAGPAA